MEDHHTRLHWIAALVLVFLCVLLYGKTLDYPMQFDSVTYLQNNPMLRDESVFPYPDDLKAFFRLPSRHGVDSDLALNMATRPLTYATFHLNWRLDGYDTEWYRVVNIGIHAINSLLVYALVLAMLGIHPSRWFAALTAAALFAVHPLAIESVTYIVQRLTSLMAMFFMLAVWLHLKANDWAGQRPAQYLRLGSVLFMICACFSKECGVMVPFMALAMDRVRSHESWTLVIRRAVPLLLCLPVVPALLMMASWGLRGELGLGSAVHLVNNREEPVNHLHYIFTEFTVLVEYLRLLVWPAGLNIDPERPFYRTLFSVPVLLSVLMMTGLWSFAWLLHRRQWLGVVSSVAGVFVFWFFGTIAISSGAAPLPDVMAEHRTYLPSVGFFAVAACLALWCYEQLGWKRVVVGAVITSVCLLSIVNWKRNEVWSSGLALWKDAADKSPGKPRVWGNLATAHAMRGELEEALVCCGKALAIEPGFGNPSILKASILNGQKRFQEALDEMNRLVATDSRALWHAEVRYNLGAAMFGLGQLAECEEVLQKNLKRWPSHWASHVGLGLVCRKRKQWAEAINHLRDALALNPTSKELVTLIEQTARKGGVMLIP